MSETDYQRGWREGAEVMRRALAQAFLEHAGEAGRTIHSRAIWLERAEATKRLAGLRAPADNAQPPDLARELAEARAQLAAAEQRAERLEAAIRQHMQASTLSLVDAPESLDGNLYAVLDEQKRKGSGK